MHVRACAWRASMCVCVCASACAHVCVIALLMFTAATARRANSLPHLHPFFSSLNIFIVLGHFFQAPPECRRSFTPTSTQPLHSHPPPTRTPTTQPPKEIDLILSLFLYVFFWAIFASKTMIEFRIHSIITPIPVSKYMSYKNMHRERRIETSSLSKK